MMTSGCPESKANTNPPIAVIIKVSLTPIYLCVFEPAM